MMDQVFSEIVEKCLVRLDRGEDLLEVLADYPYHQKKLKPLLLVAMASRSFPVPVPNHTAQRLGQNQMLAEMDNLGLRGAFRRTSQIPAFARLVSNLVNSYRIRVVSRFAPSYRLAMLILVLVMSGGFLALNVSVSSQPGDIFYPLKLSLERVQTALTINTGSRQENISQVVGDGQHSLLVSPRSSFVINGITYQINQDGRAGVAAVAEAESRANIPLPSFTGAQTRSGQDDGGNKVGEVEELSDLQDPAEEQEETKQGKTLGKKKDHQGKALGKDKPPKDHPVDKDK